MVEPMITSEIRPSAMPIELIVFSALVNNTCLGAVEFICLKFFINCLF